MSFRDAKQKVVDDFEREFLTAALARNNGNVSRTAEEIGMYRQNLQQKIRELGLEALSAIDAVEAAGSRGDTEGDEEQRKRTRRTETEAIAKDEAAG